MGENGKKKKSVFKTVLKTLGYVACGIVAAAAVFAVAITIASKKDSDGTATVFGHQLRFVQSASMEKSEYVDVSQYKIKDIKVKSCVFIETVPEDEEKAEEWYSCLEVGDVLTFKYVYTRQETITHRITDIAKNEGKAGYTITLMGDNRTSETGTSAQVIDTSLTSSSNYVIGKVVGQSYVLGLTVYALKTPVGIICIIIVPCCLIIVYEVIRIIRVFAGEKKEKQLAVQKGKDEEIERLRKQIEEIKKGNDKEE